MTDSPVWLPGAWYCFVHGLIEGGKECPKCPPPETVLIVTEVDQEAKVITVKVREAQGRRVARGG